MPDSFLTGKVAIERSLYDLHYDSVVQPWLKISQFTRSLSLRISIPFAKIHDRERNTFSISS
ncbi:MAG: hypothetical protein AAGA60_19690 [Cyanobacteria bacterium P01_E01_bin.42]